MLIITYQGRPAVYVADGRARLSAFVDVLEPDHPIRRWAMCMGYFALSVEDGSIRGSYLPGRAEHFTRCALMPERDFGALAHHDDAVLAEHFAVPLEQVEERRRDVEVARQARAASVKF